MVDNQICYLLIRRTKWPRVFCEEFYRISINKAARMFSKPGRKSYFGKEIICAHQVEEFAKFIAFKIF